MTDSSDLKVADEPMGGDDKQPWAPKLYVPITQGLRDYAEIPWTTFSSDIVLKFCDDIDAVHSALEEENKRLRKELGKRDLAKTIGKTMVEVKMHLDFKTLARELESAAQAVYSVGARFADMKDGDDDE